MLTPAQSSIIAFLDAQPNNVSDLPSLAAALGVSEADVHFGLGTLVDAGKVAYDAASGQVILQKVEGEYAPEADPAIDPAVTQAIADLFADQGVSLTTFLGGLSAAGMSGADARVGVYVARELALAIAAKRGDDRLRAPLINAAKLLGALSDAFAANGQ